MPIISPDKLRALADSLDLDLDTTREPVFRPYMISRDNLATLFAGVPESVKQYARTLRDQHGWRFYPVNQDRGRCYYRPKVITIPVWAIVKDSTHPGYKTWYISHEMAHAYDSSRSNHGDPFMQKLKEICPIDCIHYELEYKPRNAARNGISKPGEDLDDFLI